MIQSSSPTLPPSNPPTTSVADDEQQGIRIPIRIPSRRKWVVALYCLICAVFMVQETQRSIAAVWMKAIPESREGIVTITVASSSSFSSSSQYNVLNDSKYDSMPAEFARPLKGHDIKARLINFDRDDGDDDG